MTSAGFPGLAPPLLSGLPAPFLTSFGAVAAAILAGAGLGFPSLVLFFDSFAGAPFLAGAAVFFSSSSEDSLASSSEDYDNSPALNSSSSSDSFSSPLSLESTMNYDGI